MGKINLFAFLLLFAVFAEGQTVISGSVKDKSNLAPMIGVSILIEGKVEGTVTDMEGDFLLKTKEVPPFVLEFSYIGYVKRRVEIASTEQQEISIELSPNAIIGREVVVAASRIQEDMLKSPITVEKLDIIELRTTPNPNVYGALANLRGVQMNTSSLSFTSINTRGFADVQNWRFIQAVDGMEMNAPGLNYPSGTISIPPDVDVMSIELVPGAGSALYGANAFNGMLLVKSKDPFTFQGISVDVKGGFTSQKIAGTNPFGVAEFRYAKAFNNKFAFKVAASAMLFHDWEAGDTSLHITNTIVAEGYPSAYTNLGRYDPGYNAVNVYGDEPTSAVFVFLGDTSRMINRSGIPEKDLVDYTQQLFKANAALHYRINSKMELSYDYRFIQGDAVLRHTTVYPIKNFLQQLHHLKLAGSNFDFQTYLSLEDAGDSYYLLGTGTYMQRNLKPDGVWGQDYGAAYRGDVSGIAAGDHAIARAYADRDMPSSESDTFRTLLNNSLDNPDFLSGGSKFIDNSRFIHSDGNYDFTKHWDFIPIQAGASFRHYWLNSQGSLFNDGPSGFNGEIPIYEFGGYVQASKVLFKDILSLRASARFDKNQNFAGRFTPRASALVSFGKNKNHNIRLSFQNGFRNPATQEAFLSVDAKLAVLLGGLRQNVENYSYTLGTNNFITGVPSGTTISGTAIHDSLVSVASFGRYLASFDKNDLQYLNLPYLKQERVTAYEIGYRSLIGNRLYLDAFAYFNQYKNFVTRVDGYSLQALRAFGVYTNIDESIWSVGTGALVEYLLPGDYRVGFNYTYTTFNADSAVARNPGFLPSFNTPKHRFNISISNRDVWKNLGFSIKFRWSDSYEWQSPFGQNTIPSYYTLDAALMYQIPKLGMNIKMGATNLLFNEYQQIYGGPMVGSQIFIGIAYDPFAYKNKIGKTIDAPKEKDKEEEEKGFNRF